MKISKKSQLGLNFTQEMRYFIYTSQKKIIDKFPIESEQKYFDESEQKYFDAQVADLISDDGINVIPNKNYVFTKSAFAVTEKINVDKFEASFFNLEGKKTKKCTFMIDDKLFYRAVITDTYILCLVGEIKMMPISSMFPNQTHPELHPHFWYTTFRITPSLNNVYFSDNRDYMKDKNFINFIRLLIFYEFSETEEQVLKPNGAIGTRREGKFKNDSDTSIVVVDSLWNKYTRVVGEFNVSGHFRLQPCGKDMKFRKLIYIDEFMKHGYTRKATKEMNNAQMN